MIHSLKKILLLVCVWLVFYPSYAQTVRVIDNKGTINQVDGSITNEVNTSFAVIGTNLVITDSNGTLSVPLASLGTDNQNIDVLTFNTTTNILTVGIEDGNDLALNLSDLIADGSETIVTGAGINVVTGIGTTVNPYVITATEIDGSNTNEVNTSFAVNASNLEITDSNGTLSIPLTDIDSKVTPVVTTGNTIATHVSVSGTSTSIKETNTAITQTATSNTDTEVTAGTASTIATYTSEDGSTTTINETVSTLIDNGDDTFTYTNENGSTIVFDVSNTNSPNKSYVQTYKTTKKFKRENATVLNLFPEVTIQAGKQVYLKLYVPTRSYISTWGGLYVNVNVRVNGIWYNLGNTGYDGGVMTYDAYQIHALNHEMLLDFITNLGLPENLPYTVQFELTARAYNGTTTVNGSHDINRTANNLGSRGALQTWASDQNFCHIIIQEKD